MFVSRRMSDGELSGGVSTPNRVVPFSVGLDKMEMRNDPSVRDRSSSGGG